MVFSRQDPRGFDTTQRNRYNYTSGPFKRSFFTYNSIRFKDWMHKNPRIWQGMMCLGMLAVVLPVQGFVNYYGLTNNSMTRFNGKQRHFEYAEWVTDWNQRRGEWNNNFKCWSDDPDCGKDYKELYKA